MDQPTCPVCRAASPYRAVVWEYLGRRYLSSLPHSPRTLRTCESESSLSVSYPNISSAVMRFVDILGFVLSALGAYSGLLYLRFLLPRNMIPIVSLLLNETSTLLNNAEALGAIQSGSEYRMSFEMYEGCFYSDKLSLTHSTAQPSQPIFAHAHDKPPFPLILSAISTRLPIYSDLQALFPAFTH
jgi:hypothetical protein